MPRARVTFGFKLEGDKKAQRAFDGLKKGAQGKVLRPAIREGAKVVKAAAAATAPRRTGRLADTLQVRAKRMSKKRVRVEHGGLKPIAIAARTAPRAKLNIDPDDDYYYPAALEFGTKFIQALHWMESAGNAVRGQAIAVVQRVAKVKLVEVVNKIRQKGA